VVSLLHLKDIVPNQAWALGVALILVGIEPSPEAKWMTTIEEQLRRWVHSWFLVPDGIEKTIAVLEDAPYEPPAEALANPVREQLQDSLERAKPGLETRWVRARMLMESLKQMGDRPNHPLKLGKFSPFRKNFDALRDKYKALAQEIEALPNT